MKNIDELGTVCNYRLEATWTTFLYTPCVQGTAPFMHNRLLTALATMELGLNASDSTFQHRLHHDFESLIWVVVYAMMIHNRIILASTDPERCEQYKTVLDTCWAGHAYDSFHRSHSHMIMTGFSVHSQLREFWFPDPREAAFFRDAMRLVLNQLEGGRITYEDIRTLFKQHIQLAMEPQPFDVVSKWPLLTFDVRYALVLHGPKCLLEICHSRRFWL